MGRFNYSSCFPSLRFNASIFLQDEEKKLINIDLLLVQFYCQSPILSKLIFNIPLYLFSVCVCVLVFCVSVQVLVFCVYLSVCCGLQLMIQEACCFVSLNLKLIQEKKRCWTLLQKQPLHSFSLCVLWLVDYDKGSIQLCVSELEFDSRKAETLTVITLHYRYIFFLISDMVCSFFTNLMSFLSGRGRLLLPDCVDQQKNPKRTSAMAEAGMSVFIYLINCYQLAFIL